MLLPFLCCAGALAAPATVSPEKPDQGSTITIRYDPSDKDSRLRLDDAVHVVAWVYRRDGTETVWKPMLRTDGAFLSRIALPTDAAFVRFHFVTPSAWDDALGLETMVYGVDGLPAPGAWTAAMTPRSADADFKKEIKRHPGWYRAYRQRWFFSKMAGKDITERIREDVKKLETIESERPAALLYVLASGHFMLDEEAAGRAYLLELIERYPDSRLTVSGFNDHYYHVFSRQLDGSVLDAVKAKIRTLAADHPTAPLARNQVWNLAHDEATPLEVVEKVCAMWIDEQPDHPEPRVALADLLANRSHEPARGAESAWRAADLLVAGKLRFYEDISGKMTVSMLAAVYATAARLHLLSEQYGRALAAARMAQEQSERPAKAFLLEAEVWSALGDRGQEETAYLHAWQADPTDVEPRLKALYVARNGEEKGFDSWLETRAEKIRPRGELDLAPTFEVKTLDGEKLASADLRGHVVVLNFWFRGCAPCMVEMPGLNRLVVEFADRPVTFLALGMDSEKSLRGFLKSKEFAYRHVAAAVDVHAKFDIVAYPTHIIIDREGRIRHRMSGGNEEIDQELGPLIEALVRAGSP